MLRKSGCRFGDWFHSPPHFSSFFSSVSKLILFFPQKILDTSYISEEKKDQSLPTPDSLSLPSNSTLLLLPSQLYSSLPACLPLSALFHGERNSGSAVPVRNYAPCAVWLSSAGRTDGEMSIKAGQQRAFGSNLFQDLCCAPLPPLCQITLGSHSTLSVDRGASSAPSNGHNANYKPTPPAQEPYFPFKCQNVKYNVWKWRADNLKPTQSAFVKCSVRKAWSMEDRTEAKRLLHNQTSANNLSDVQSCTCCLCWSQIIFSIKLFIKSYMIILSNTMMERIT